ncbi:MAG: TetR/AcrR family transcriptional regulator [Solirubrobacterales bacterium]
MTTRPAKRLSAAERRDQIERSATELFASRGYAATTVDEITRAAGVTKPMLYRHFESKQELCIRLLERYRDELVSAPLARFDPDAVDRREHHTAMIGAWLDHARSNPAATRLLFTPITGDSEVGEAQRDLYERQRATQAALLREFAPALEDEEIEPMAEMTRASLAALGLWWLDHADVDRERLVAVLLRMFEALIGSPADVRASARAKAKGGDR